MEKSKYSASMTGCGFLFYEFTRLVPLMLATNASELLADEIKNNNLMQINSELTRKRAMTELKKRFAAVPVDFWSYYLSLGEEDQRIALFYAILKQYYVIFDLQKNVVLSRWRSVEPNICAEALMMRMYEISAEDPAVDSWSEETKKKIVSWFLTILAQVGIADKRTRSLSPVRMQDYSWFAQNGEEWFLAACLLDTSEIQQLIEPFKTI